MAFYAQSKFANVLFALELDRRLKAVGLPVRSLLAHPGYAATNLQLSGPTGILKLFMLLTSVVFVGYGIFAASIRSHVVSRPMVLTWMRRTFAGAFVMLGAKLALADR